MYGSWLHIDILWIREDAHHLGYGKWMVVEAEAAGIRRGCKHAQVDTHDFQAHEFYRKLGFKVWGVLDDLPPGYQRIFFRKDL